MITEELTLSWFIKRILEEREPKSPGVIEPLASRVFISSLVKPYSGKYFSSIVWIPLFSRGLNSTQKLKRRCIALSIICFRFVVQIRIPLNSSIWVRNSFTIVRSQLCWALFLSAKKESASSKRRIEFVRSASSKACLIFFSLSPTNIPRISEARFNRISFSSFWDIYLASSVFPVPLSP